MYFDGITFGMEIETGTKAYEYFKKSVKDEMAYSIFGDPIKVLAVPHMAVAAIMEEAHWLVSTEKYLNIRRRIWYRVQRRLIGVQTPTELG